MEALKARRQELWRRQPFEHDQERKQMPNTPLATHQHAKKAAVQARRAKVTREQATCPLIGGAKVGRGPLTGIGAYAG